MQKKKQEKIAIFLLPLHKVQSGDHSWHVSLLMSIVRMIPMCIQTDGTDSGTSRRALILRLIFTSLRLHNRGGRCWRGDFYESLAFASPHYCQPPGFCFAPTQLYI